VTRQVNKQFGEFRNKSGGGAKGSALSTKDISRAKGSSRSSSTRQDSRVC